MKMTNTVQYTGQVTVSIANEDGKILKQVTGHNEGKYPLYQFLGKCLVGTFYSELRPCRIRLFAKQAESNVIFDESTRLSAAVKHEPSVSESSINDGTTDAYKITYHFRIPYAFLTIANGQKIKWLAIYSEYNSGEDKLGSFSALYKLADKDEIDLTTIKTNYTIVVDWAMTLTGRADT